MKNTIITLFLILTLSNCGPKSTVDVAKKDSIAGFSKDDYPDYENIDKSQDNDEFIDNLYRNKKYKFRIEYPNNWDLNHGQAIHSVFKAQKPDLGASITVNIMPWDGDPKPQFDHSDAEYANSVDQIKLAFASQNITLINFNMYKAYLFNFPAYKIKCEYMLRMQEYEIPYSMLQIQCLHRGAIFTVVASMPTQAWTEEMNQIINNSINSFRFEDL